MNRIFTAMILVAFLVAAGREAQLAWDPPPELTPTNAHDADSDGDGLSDGAELTEHETDPANPDSDGDGLTDGEEVLTHRTDPHEADADGGGVPDGREVKAGTDPRDPSDDMGDVDTDQDQLTDTLERGLGTDPTRADSDRDGLTDHREYTGPDGRPDTGDETNPLARDTDEDGLDDRLELEKTGTDPTEPDTDDDGLSDGAEHRRGTDPLEPDTDDDGLLDGDEVDRTGTDPLVADTDGDGLVDGQETATSAPAKVVPATHDQRHNDSLEGQLAALSQRVVHLETPAAPPPPAPPKRPIVAFTDGLFDMAKAAVMSIVLPLIGAMAFFLGLMKVAERAGLTVVIAKLLRPIMIRLFPDVPATHPAMSAMILNMSANALGLGNAATPFGLAAMKELDTLNGEKGTATNAMCLFLAINTSSVTILPTGVIAIRATLDSQDPQGIMATTLFATMFSTTAAILTAKFLQRFSDAPPVLQDDRVDEEAAGAYPLWVSVIAIAALVALVPTALIYGEQVGPWIVPGIVVGFIGVGAARGVPVYEAFVEGAKEGWTIAVTIIPYLVAILCAVGMLRGSGAIDLFVGAVGSYTMALGMPAEALPMALLRPLSGSGAYGVMMATMTEHGPDSYVGYIVSTLQGSTETTFYVLAVYFGAVNIKRIRHAMAAALTADAVGIAGAVAGCALYFSYNGLW